MHLARGNPGVLTVWPGARDCRIGREKSSSRARPRMRPEDSTSLREVCYDRSGGNFPTLPCKAESCKGSVDKLLLSLAV
jgi:hypothetical protein